MKNKYQFISIIIGLMISLIAWANTNTFQTSITGLTGPAAENAQNAIIDFQEKITTPISQSTLPNIAHSGITEIKQAIKPYGYFRSKITFSIKSINHQWLVSYHVIPGSVLRVSQFKVAIRGPGAKDRAFRKQLRKFATHPGQPLNIPQYESIKEQLFALASNRGYFKAKMVRNKIFIDLEKYTAKIIIVFDTGPRYRIGPTYFSKNPFANHFLRKFLHYHEGQYYNFQKLQKTQQNLANSSYFQQAIVTPLPHRATNSIIPIEIHLQPRPAKQYSFGVGYGTDTGFRGTLGIDLRRVNAHGHRFNTLLQGSQFNNSLVANYIIPGTNPLTDQFAIGAGIGNIDQKTGKSRSAKVALSYTMGIGSWQQIIALTYLNERYNLTGLPHTNVQLIYPSISWHFLKTDHAPRPTQGLSLAIALAGTPAALNKSKANFFQVRTDTKTLYTLFHHTRILMRASLGHTVIPNIVNLPLSLQLFAGGARSIRGYTYNSIGPGRNLFTGSFEIQQQIKGNWYIAGFIDAGNVTNNNPFDHLKLGAGPALVWLSPVGAIEVSVANSFNQPKKRWRVQFTMGPEL